LIEEADSERWNGSTQMHQMPNGAPSPDPLAPATRLGCQTFPAPRAAAPTRRVLKSYKP